MVYLLDGGAEIVIMSANQLHVLRAINKFKMILTMIRS